MTTSDPNRNEEIEITADDGVDLTAQPDPTTDAAEETLHCAQCQIAVSADHAVQTDNAVFCTRCFAELKRVLEDSLAGQSQNINYLGAVAGGLLGGLLGALIWWGFVMVTNIQFGLIAVVIGWGAGKGVVMFSGHKRSRTLQVISVSLAALSYGMASYWVMMSAFHEYFAENGITTKLPMIPTPALFVDVVSAGFQMFDLIFLAFALWQAWKMPAPVVLNSGE